MMEHDLFCCDQTKTNGQKMQKIMSQVQVWTRYETEKVWGVLSSGKNEQQNVEKLTAILKYCDEKLNWLADGE